MKISMYDKVNKRNVDWLYEFVDYLWLKLIEPRMVYILNKKDWDFTFLGKIFYYSLIVPLQKATIFYWFISLRIVCLIRGCDIQFFSHFNVPYNILSEECKRCGAFDEFGMTSDYGIVYK